jgi:hypothetical protein
MLRLRGEARFALLTTPLGMTLLLGWLDRLVDVEGRVEVDEVNGLVLDVLAEDG